MAKQLDDAEYERLLSQGSPGGPRLDRVWANLNRGNAAKDQPQPARRSWFAALWVLVPACATAMLLWIWPTGYQERGGDQGLPRLESSCGAPGASCPVGHPVFLRVDGAPAGGYVSVVLLQNPSTWIVQNMSVEQLRQGHALPTKLIPESADAATGIRLRLVTHSQRLSQELLVDLAKNVVNEEASRKAHTSELVLRVAP